MSDTNGHHTGSPAKGRGRGRGRGGYGRAAVARAAARKAAAANAQLSLKPTDGSHRTQAVEERVKELRNAFAAVSNAVRPALEELADRNLDLLRDQFNAHTEVTAFKQIRKFLDTRSKDALGLVSRRYEADASQAKRTYEVQCIFTQLDYQRKFDEATEEFYDAQLRRLDILEHMRNHRLPVDLEEDAYNFLEVSQERLDWQKAHVEMANGVEVPCAKIIQAPHVVRIEEARKEQLASLHSAQPSPSKRKADAELTGQGPPKRPASALGTEARPSYIPRHIGGLLSANAVDDNETPSRAPSPVGSKLPSPSPEMALKTSADGELSYLPAAASDPDEHGVRLISRRRPATVENYNRLMLPCLFEYEDHEIGFRDSFNDRTRYKSTRLPQFFNQPNSFAFFVDRMISSVDIGNYEDGDLSDELIQKHGLHPKYGLFLKTSRNDAEPPLPKASGDRPTVFIAPTGETLHASRTIARSRLDAHNEDRELKSVLAKALATFREREAFAHRELCPTALDKEAHRNAMLKGRDHPLPSPAYLSASRSPTPQPEQAVATPDGALDAEDQARGDDVVEPDAEDRTTFEAAIAAILDAANSVNDEETKAAAASQPRRTRFDPVRDVVSSPEPAPVAKVSTPNSEDDFSMLCIMADVASEAPRHVEPIALELAEPSEHPNPEGGFAAAHIDAEQQQGSMYPHIPSGPAPTLVLQQHGAPDGYYGHSIPSNSAPAPPHVTDMQSPMPPQEETYHRRSSADGYYIDPALDPRLFSEAQPEQQPHGPDGYSQQQNGSSNGGNHFLQTALNPASNYGAAPSAAPVPSSYYQGEPPSAQYHDIYSPATSYAHPRSETPPYRGTYSSSTFGSRTGTPGLPMLRTGSGGPFSHQLMDAQEATEPTGGPQQAPPPQNAMHHPNGGSTSSYPLPPVPPPIRQHYPGNVDSMHDQMPVPNKQAPVFVQNFLRGIGTEEPQQQQQQPPPHHGGTPFMTPPGMHPPPPPMQHQVLYSHQYGPPVPQGHYQIPPPYPPFPPHGHQQQPMMMQMDMASAPPSRQASRSNSNGNIINIAPAPPGGSHHGVNGNGTNANGNNMSSNNANANANNNNNNNNNNNSKYRKLEPAPTPPHRRGVGINGPELRTVQFDYETIKDYEPTEPPPRHGPTTIRGWTYNNIKKPKVSNPPPTPKE
ncbi:hypothetical protein RB594_003098 [Gaeumannomyces avenae]